MSYIPSTTFNTNQFSLDASARVRTSQFITLGEYKEVLYKQPLLYTGAGTGSYPGSGSPVEQQLMHVEAGQWLVNQTKLHHPYFSGKSQVAEITCDTFAPQNNVTKRYGYFDCLTDVTPFSANLDGMWLESSNGTIKFCIYNNGNVVYESNINQWLGYESLATYDWNKFTTIVMDFLWLGGAAARLFIKTENGFVLADQYTHAGAASGVMFQTPAKPLRAEIYSQGGVGDFRPICGQVASEGSLNEMGYNRMVNSDIQSISYSPPFVKRPLIAVRKSINYNNIPLRVNDLFLFSQTQDDKVYWTLEINPGLSGTELNWQNLSNSAIQYALGTDSDGVSANGTIIACGVLGYNQVIPTGVLKDSQLSWICSAIDGTSDVFVLTVTPLIGTSTVIGGIGVKEF